MIKHILVPIDGSEHAQRALETAKSLIESLSGDRFALTILHVNPELSYNEPPLGVDVESKLEEEGRSIIESVAHLFEGMNLKLETVSLHGDPAKLICETARDHEVDLIIMGTRGMSLVTEMLLGSVSHQVIQHAHCPVMTVK
ncbi:universal stress protein [Paenibacillus tuaregi]|uniref:universal stress protein n=1 Tax=Paenibacillus tuaregi TaxID=1816681 RepID=UPI0008394007|nr:universal stress protein [Paenibacillus tuaregi]